MARESGITSYSSAKTYTRTHTHTQVNKYFRTVPYEAFAYTIAYSFFLFVFFPSYNMELDKKDIPGMFLTRCSPVAGMPCVHAFWNHQVPPVSPKYIIRRIDSRNGGKFDMFFGVVTIREVTRQGGKHVVYFKQGASVRDRFDLYRNPPSSSGNVSDDVDDDGSTSFQYQRRNPIEYAVPKYCLSALLGDRKYMAKYGTKQICHDLSKREFSRNQGVRNRGREEGEIVGCRRGYMRNYAWNEYRLEVGMNEHERLEEDGIPFY